jgi:hypothetical protein
LPVRSGRLVAAIVALLAIVIVTSFQAPRDVEARKPRIDRFLHALSQIESGGNYRARNRTSGAYGKYQIMPSNWPAWARRYLGDSGAPQSPRNQERVARSRILELFHGLGSWRRVAYWWLTGSSRTSGWSKFATHYVNNVMAVYKRTAIKAGSGTVRRYSENSSRITYGGRWTRAEHASYRGDTVRQAKRKNQVATFRFTGRQVAWNGPKGPTRGEARVYVDGRYVKTVDLYARRFDPRDRIFTKSFGRSGAHRLTIKVMGTPGHPVVAIDEFLVWD